MYYHDMFSSNPRGVHGEHPEGKTTHHTERYTLKKYIAVIFSLMISATFAQAASSFLFVSSELSWLGRGREFFGEDDQITFSQRQNFNLFEFGVGINNSNESGWLLTFNVGGRPITPGLYDTLRYLEHYPQPEIPMTFSFTSERNSPLGQLVGIVDVHEAVYLGGDYLYRFAADILVLEEGNEEKWNYMEIRQNSDVPHLVPEPATGMLFLIGCGMMLRNRRR